MFHHPVDHSDGILHTANSPLIRAGTDLLLGAREEGFHPEMMLVGIKTKSPHAVRIAIFDASGQSFSLNQPLKVLKNPFTLSSTMTL